jgi:hypothetical protein
MNERIKELAVQAKEYARSHVADCRRFGYYMEYNEYELRFEKKFAELIVRECIKICSDVEADTEMNLSDGALVCMAEIKEHFGVEE